MYMHLAEVVDVLQARLEHLLRVSSAKQYHYVVHNMCSCV